MEASDWPLVEGVSEMFEGVVVLVIFSLSQRSTPRIPGEFPQKPLGGGHAWVIDAPTSFRNLPFGLGPAVSARESEEALVRGLLRTLSVFRIAALTWAIAGFALSREHLVREPLAWVFVGLMVVCTIMLTPRRGGSAILDPLATSTVVFEIVIGLTVLLGDGLVYDELRPQSLPWSWPAAGVMAAGIVFGTRAGLITALITGAASYASEVVMLNRSDSVVAAVSKMGLWVLTGTIAGYVVTRLRRAEAEISEARARESFARELHDGVLQTLAVIQRRSTDAELAALARDQEHDLRGFLAGTPGETLAFEPSMHALAARHERLYPSCKVNVVVAGDLPQLSESQLDALSGAVGESLTNASKHGEATTITIYAEPTDDTFSKPPEAAPNAAAFVSIKDDGAGFDVAEMIESIGVSRSIKGRLEDVGGFADIDSAAGRGTEVQLWL